MDKEILNALNEANKKLQERVPQHKSEIHFICIEDVKPMDLPKFIEENKVPQDCWFGLKEQGHYSEVVLYYSKTEPTTETEKLKFCQRNFNTVSALLIAPIMRKNGYKKVGVWSSEYKKFDKMYDMYINQDFEQLEKYIFLPYKK